MIKLTTNHGAITLELDAEKAPRSAANFLAYVESGHYDNTIFHRVIDGFMIQGGGFALSRLASLPVTQTSSRTSPAWPSARTWRANCCVLSTPAPLVSRAPSTLSAKAANSGRSRSKPATQKAANC